ncbi:hypothetical protein CPC08DRAFT_384109 [Agrocybe pediades]|nr:hypothetical protein CPC08DRAFT_384109 [Agrocybe pediades]
MNFKSNTHGHVRCLPPFYFWKGCTKAMLLLTRRVKHTSSSVRVQTYHIIISTVWGDHCYACLPFGDDTLCRTMNVAFTFYHSQGSGVLLLSASYSYLLFVFLLLDQVRLLFFSQYHVFSSMAYNEPDLRITQLALTCPVTYPRTASFNAVKARFSHERNSA